MLIVYDGSTTYWYAVQGNTEIQSSVYSVMYTSDQTITMPAKCRSIDLVLCGAGGLAGDSSSDIYGGTGSGGNIQSANGIPIGEQVQLTLSFVDGFDKYSNKDSGYVILKYSDGQIVLAQAYNGNKGTSFNGGSIGAETNTVEGEYDSSMGIYFTAFGSNGVDGGYVLPSMGANGCPKGSTEWVEGDYGMAQRIPGEKQGKGYCLITYHIGK